MILAWWKEGLGGAITIGSLIAILIVGDVSGSGGWFMLICASPGFLFLLSWLLSRPAMLSRDIPDSEENPPQPPTSEKP
jgi:hypothetical protein